MKTGKRPLKTFVLGSLLISGMCLASQVQASDRRVATERFTEFAPVINVEPIYRQVRIEEPRRECWVEQQRQIVGYETVNRYEHANNYRNQRQQSSGNAIIGGVIGGVIGNQLGRGHSSHSRATATVAGAIIGGAIGNEAGKRNTHRRFSNKPTVVDSRPIYETREVEQCRQNVVSRTERSLQYYNVTYRYKGRTFTTQLPRDPGNQIELQVSVAPARR